MALQSGTVVLPEKVPVQWYNNHQLQPPHHHMDEREGFLMWLRCEFAAANAIIDALCQHLRTVGDPGEYDGVIGSIQQRRCIWNPILHMQQYFPVSEVVYSLQQVGWRRQQQKTVRLEGTGRVGGGGKDYRGGVRGQRGGTEVHSLGGEVNGKDLNDGYGKSYSNANEKLGGDKPKVEVIEEKKGSFHVDGSKTARDEKNNLQVSPRTFVATEICEGKSVNIAEGMKLYEDLLDDSEISKLFSLVNDLRAAGRRGQLNGHAFVNLKRPMRGHGREIIQLGVPIADARPDHEAAVGTSSKDLKAEPIPELLQDVIERLLTEKVVSIKPDSIMIDYFNEGDYSQPHFWPQSFGRPVCVLFLTECEMSIGTVITIDHPGDYRGALQLSLSSGSVLVMQGRSADFARHAMSSLRKQRILVTLVNSQPKKINASDAHRFPPTPAPAGSWPPPPSRSPSHNRPVAPKHFGPVPPPLSVLSSPIARPQLPPPNNGIQPIFAPNPMTPAISYPAPVHLPPASASWPAGPPRHPPPIRLLVPGTGVFFPPQGSGNSSNQPASTLPTENITIETPAGSEENGMKKPNDAHVLEQECNGSTDGGTVITKEEKHANRDLDEGDGAVSVKTERW